MQLVVDVHKVSFTAFERADLLHQIQQETNCTVTQLAERVQMSQPAVSKLLALRKLSPGVRRMVEHGDFDVEKAYAISAEPDFAKQEELAVQAQGMSRDHVRRVVRPRGRQKHERPVSVARFALDPDTTVSVQGNELNLGGVIDLLTDCVKELRKGVTQGLNITTQQKVMRDRAAAMKGKP